MIGFATEITRETIDSANIGVITEGSNLSYINYLRGSTYIQAAPGYSISYLEYYFSMTGYRDTYWVGRIYFSSEPFTLLQNYNDGTYFTSRNSTKYNYANTLNVFIDSDVISGNDINEGYLDKFLPRAVYLGLVDGTDYVLNLVSGLLVDNIAGGIDSIIADGIIDSPADVIYPPAIVLNPDVVSDAALEDILEKVIAGEMTWVDYWERVTSSALPAVEVNEKVYELDNEGVSGREVDNSSSSGGLDDYKLDLTKLFPFCIPFDLYNLLSCLCANPEAPKIKWMIPLSAIGLDDYVVEIDLKAWDSVAQMVRDMELLGFCVGLAFVTRNLIRG